MQKVTPFLWFDNQLGEAIEYYKSVFKNMKVTEMNRLDDARTGEKGAVMTATFEIEGQQIMALNGGPSYKLSPAVSLFVSCDNQEEVDHLWRKLTDGGQELQCGWLTDRFGLTWQIIPKALGELMGDPNPTKAQAVMQAMWKMQKIDIATLREAHVKAVSQ